MPAPGETFQGYTLEERVPRPEGAVTEAFLARDRSGEQVLVELVREGATSVEKARFGLRARRLLGVQHPALIAAREASATWSVLEHPAGVPLSEHAGLAIARARQKLAWVAQIAAAIARLHKGGIVHGDVTLDAIVVSAGATVKLLVPLSADVSRVPLDDVRALAFATCTLVLGSQTGSILEDVVRARVHDAGVAPEAAAVVARVCAGGSMSSEDFAQRLAPFADFAGPTTEPLLPVVPRR